MAKKLSPFEEAFKEARAEGKKTFTFNGKSYGTVTADDEQKRVDKMPSMSRTQGETKTTQGATYPKPAAAPAPKPKADEKSLLDKYRESDMAKGFRDARATFGDTPSTDMLMRAGQVGIAAMPVGRALSAANKYLSKKDSPATSVSDDAKDPLFNPEKMVDRRSTTFPGRSEPKFNPEKMADRSRSEPAFNPEKMADRSRSEPAFNLEKMAGRDRSEPGFKKGGKVSGASKRGDGIAQRGRTKGRFV
jgi:hypothetical protein